MGYPYPNNFWESVILTNRDVNDAVDLTVPVQPNGDSVQMHPMVMQNSVVAKFDPVDEEVLEGEVQDATEQQKDIDLEGVKKKRDKARPTKAPKPTKPTQLKTPKPTKAPKTPKPTKLKTPKPTTGPKTPRPKPSCPAKEQ